VREPINARPHDDSVLSSNNDRSSDKYPKDYVVPSIINKLAK